jgi:uncharacterized Tic20 family protein
MTTDIPEAPNAPLPPVPPVPPAPPALAPLTPADERTWAMLAHMSVLLNLVTGFLGPVAALVVYLIFQNRSRYVAYQALQSFVFQLIFWAGGGALLGLMWAATGLLSAVLVGILLIPVACVLTFLFALMPIAALFYGFWAGIETSQGKDFKYWLVGDWLRGTLTN